MSLNSSFIQSAEIVSQPKAESAAPVSLPAIADLRGRVSGVVRGFRSSIWRSGTATTMSLVRTIGMIGCHRVYIRDICSKTSQHLTTTGVNRK